MGFLIEAVVFAIIAVLIPAAMLVFSWLIRPKGGNELLEENYESGEETIGGKVGVMREYLHYFSIFLLFELIGVVLLAFGAVASSVKSSSGLLVLLLPVSAFLLVLIMLGMAKHAQG